jgi:ATP-dependent DNA helicase RecQ
MTTTDRLERERSEQHMHTVLARLAGPGAMPRADQVDAVHAVLQPASRVLVVQATGWGKSAVYWAATHAIRSTGAGPTLVVSPLLALMRDQVSAAERAGLKAATVNSTNIEDWDEVFERLDQDAIDVLLVSPERLGNPRFAARLGALLAKVGLIVIDEAHCISDWGFDFRPDYQRLARALLSTPTASVLATTATANQRVTQDIGKQLGESTLTFRGTLARTSLTLSVVPGLSPLQRYAWMADALEQLPDSGIVYVLTVAEAERLTAFLRSCGHAVEAYTGQTDANTRLQVEERLRHNQVKAVVATSALGMGYDKPDLGFCVHVGSPATPVAYYQQVGRAGRAVVHAEGVLLPSDADERIWDYFATASIPDAATAAKVLGSLKNQARSLLDIEAETGTRRGRLEALLKILAVEGVVDKEGASWRATGAPYVHDSAKWSALAQVRQQEAGIMRQYAQGQGCLMAYLQTALDDPAPAPCGRCSVCTGALPFPGLSPSQDKLIWPPETFCAAWTWRSSRANAGPLGSRARVPFAVLKPGGPWPLQTTRAGSMSCRLCGGSPAALARAWRMIKRLALPTAPSPRPCWPGLSPPWAAGRKLGLLGRCACCLYRPLTWRPTCTWPPTLPAKAVCLCTRCSAGGAAQRPMTPRPRPWWPILNNPSSCRLTRSFPPGQCFWWAPTPAPAGRPRWRRRCCGSAERLRCCCWCCTCRREHGPATEHL